ncbi:hypothetical protein [Rheinheimera faecalis]|uniref:hypothetical protein n=1 Tax=Rheinheimera faecalis TaxID=2901141 RepID=UPI001E500570|nr:hypothetical protein [Rheinheimera faecalis]
MGNSLVSGLSSKPGELSKQTQHELAQAEKSGVVSPELARKVIQETGQSLGGLSIGLNDNELRVGDGNTLWRGDASQMDTYQNLSTARNSLLNEFGHLMDTDAGRMLNLNFMQQQSSKAQELADTPAAQSMAYQQGMARSEAHYMTLNRGRIAQQQQQLQTTRQLDAMNKQTWLADQARARMTTLEKVQLGLDVVGMTEIPLLSQVAELGSAGISAYSGDYVGAGLSVASMVPFAGKAAEVVKMERLTERVQGYSDAAQTSTGRLFRPEMVDSYLSVRFEELASSGRPKVFMLGEGQREVVKAAKANNNAVQILEIWPDNMKFMDTYDPLTNKVKPGFEAMHEMSIDFNKHVIKRLHNEGYEFKTIGTKAPDRLSVSSDWYKAELDVLRALGVKPKQISWKRAGQ